MKWILLYFLLATNVFAKSPMLDVGILQGQKKVTISAKFGFQIFNLEDNKKKIFTRWNSSFVKIHQTQHGFGFLNKKDFHRLYIKPFKRQNILVNGKAYRGTIEIFEDKFGKLTIVNKVDLESYLYSVIKAEMLITSPIEALKAQAVVARTYAMKNKDKFRDTFGFGLTADVRSQVYSGVESEHPLSIKVVKQTNGMVITHNKELISTYYHSACGGSTLDSKHWLGKDVEFLKSKTCNWCNAYKNYKWSLDIPYEKLKNLLRLDGNKISKILHLDLTNDPQGRLSSVLVSHPQGKIKISGTKLRKLIGASIMRSTMAKEVHESSSTNIFQADEQAIMDILNRFGKPSGSRVLVLKGQGFGHGVGLCQWGAKGLAKQNKSFKNILKYYYSNVDVIKTYY